MNTPVSLPLWLLILILGFASIAALTHVFAPSVRWFFRGRMERLVAKLNTKLAQPIRPFKLMRRPDMIVRLVHDAKVMQAVVEEARETGEPESVVFERARRYAREIVPSFSVAFYFRYAMRIAKWLARLFYHVRVGHIDAKELGAIDREATMVFVMNHRSNMDYVLVTHLAANHATLSYAVGEWAQAWPLSTLIRAMGAYFIRRKSGNLLYRRVLARYVQLATEEGIAQAFFPEGLLSSDGRVGEPKLGLLNYMIDGYVPGNRDIVFVPVAVSYDRVPEDRAMVDGARDGVRHFRVPHGRILLGLVRIPWQKLRGTFKRFGYAAVSFGTPLSLNDYLAAPHKDVTAELGAELMARITRVVTALPAPIVAASFGPDRSLTREELTARVTAFAADLTARGAPLHLPKGSAEAATTAGLDALILRGIVVEQAGTLTVPADMADLLQFYANAALQLRDAHAAKTVRSTRKKKTSKT